MTLMRRCRALKTTSALCLFLASLPACVATLAGPALSAEESAVISAPEVLQVNAGGQQPLPLSVTSGGALPKNAMLLISGLPTTSSLSAGRLFASGTWALRLTDVDGLKIETTPNAHEQTQLTLSVVTLEGETLAERKVRLAVAPAGPEPSAKAEEAKPEPKSTAQTGPVDTEALFKEFLVWREKNRKH